MSRRPQRTRVYSLRGHLPLRALTSEATSGITALSGLAGVVTMVLMTYLHDYKTIGPGGGNTLNIPLALCYLLAPLLGGLAALRAGRLKSQGALDLAATTPRGRLCMLAYVCVAFAAWAAIAYLSGALVVGASVGVNGPWTPRMALLLVEAFALLTVFIACGITIGCRLPHVLVGPAVTIFGTLGLAILDLAPDPIGRFSPIFGDKFYGYGSQPNGPLLTGLIAVMVAIVTGVIGQGLFATRPLRAGSAAIAGCLLAFGFLRVLTASPDPLEARTDGPGLCRRQDGIGLCVWPGPGVRIDTDLATLLRVRDIAAPVLPGLPTDYHEEGLPGPSTATVGPAPTIAGESYGGIAREAMVPQPCSGSTLRDRLELMGLLLELLNPGSTATTEEPVSTGAAMARHPAARQRAWAAPRLSALRACD